MPLECYVNFDDDDQVKFILPMFMSMLMYSETNNHDLFLVYLSDATMDLHKVS